MPTLADTKYAALQTLTGASVGTINDLEKQWLLIETGLSEGTIGDLYSAYLTGQGCPVRFVHSSMTTPNNITEFSNG